MRLVYYLCCIVCTGPAHSALSTSGVVHPVVPRCLAAAPDARRASGGLHPVVKQSFGALCVRDRWAANASGANLSVSGAPMTAPYNLSPHASVLPIGFSSATVSMRLLPCPNSTRATLYHRDHHRRQSPLFYSMWISSLGSSPLFEPLRSSTRDQIRVWGELPIPCTQGA